MASKSIIYFWYLVNRIIRSVDDSVEYSLPHLRILGLIGVFGFPLYYWVWKDIFPQPYESLELRLAGSLLFLGLATINYWPSVLQKYLKIYWIIAFTYGLSFFFTFMLLNNNCNLVWAMSNMAALTLLILVGHDWILTIFLFILGSALAFIAFLVSDYDPASLSNYWAQLPIYLFVVVAGSAFNYQSSRLRQEKLKLLASMGAQVAHELRTPLLSIEQHIKFIKNDIENKNNTVATENPALLSSDNSFNLSIPYIKENASNALIETAHAHTIIDMLLMDLSRGNIDKNQLTYYSINEIVETSLQRFPFSSIEQRESVTNACEDDFLFLGSDVLLLHVLFNLIKNALRYLGSDGTINITSEYGANGNRIIVNDTGRGIPLDQQAYIFEEFYTSEKAGKGSGIGLSFCKKVMEDFGGDIHCESIPGQFTAFTLTFPPVSSEVVKKHRQGKLADLLSGLQKKRILFVDDEPVFSQKILSELPDKSLDFTSVTSAAEALQHLRRTEYDILIVDLNMPEMDGLTFIRAIRETGDFSDNNCLNHRAVPILAFSAEPKERANAESQVAGANAFLSKGCNITEFLQALNDCLRLSETQALKQAAGQKLRDKTLLIVDDESINRTVIRELLQSINLQILEASSGKTALELLETHRCDWIISDLQMPDMDGLQLAKEIRAGKPQEACKTTPIIAISGDPRDELESHCAAAGVDTLLRKPLNETVVLEALVNYSRHADPPQASPPGKDQSSIFSSTETLQYEAVSKMVHDLLTPAAVIETNADLYRNYIPLLVSLYYTDTEKALKPKALQALLHIPETLAQAAHLHRTQTQDFWQIFKTNNKPQFRSQLLTDFVVDMEKIWDEIEQSVTANLVPYLPLLLEHYRQTSRPQTQENSTSIPESRLSWLHNSITDISNAIDSVRSQLEGHASKASLRRTTSSNTQTKQTHVEKIL